MKMRFSLCLLLGQIVTALLFLLGNILPSYGASWVTNAPMNGIRYRHTATRLPDGRVLVAGGDVTDVNSATQSAELYDPVSGTWTPASPMNLGRANHTATLLNDGTVLVVGGGGNPSFGDNVPEIYDPATGLWTTNSTTFATRVHHTATLLTNGQVLVTGGMGFYSPDSHSGYLGALAVAELYDPISGTWTNVGSMNIPRYFHSATLLQNGKVLVAGGATSSSSNSFNSAELYDPQTSTWSYTGSMIEPHAYHRATLLPNGKVLVEPSLDSNYYYTGDAELYDPVTGTWTNVAPMVITRSLHTATLLPNGKVLTAGGTNFPSEIFNPADETWSISGTMNTPRVFATATLLQNGNVLVTGGMFGDVAQSSSEIYTSSNITVSAFDSLSAVKSSANMFKLSFTNTLDVSFLVCSATNLFLPLDAWTIVGGAVEVSPGQYQFTDILATNGPQRFYRVRSP